MTGMPSEPVAALDRAEDPLLDIYADRYASRTVGMSAGEVRALFAVASRPEVISLAGGMPYIDALPMDQIADLVDHVMRERGSLALQYGGGIGQLGLRVRLAELLATE